MTELTDKKSARVVAFIQARMGSTRLPGKVLMPLLEKPMLSYIVERLKKAELVDEIVVATSERPENDKIREFCKKNSISCFSGSEDNVLDRFYKAAKENHADIVIRVTGDCPLIDPQLVGKLVKFFLENEYEYISLATGAGVANEEFKGCRFPDGTDTEVFNFEVLEIAWKEAKEALETEHVTPFIWKRPERFKLYSYKSDVDYSQMRWVVDNKEDFEFIEAIYKALYPKNPNFGMNDVLDFLKRNPILLEKNKHFVGSEGYEEFWK
ncbi:MAG: glycosyltransferase family protein [Nanoarchaeota archaeon]|nr:glycosyltransferase family protein [Nanoarchaeota archaeon]MBU1321070.1 glycosyltransferase family protein [Nanoarchaeota archaeon]MBU1597075.1 glycosyltransferase family protein [Nanoarchaeota archaeon]MBU2440865.1 glycosyltransferase family protein [Nanoarchaeota archaeon]